jgi:hypothetical protein
MSESEKQRLATEIQVRWMALQDALSDRRRYPMEKFRAFWEAGKRYADLTRDDELIHRKVAVAINGLAEFLSAERKRVPESVVCDAERLECMLFAGYDPHFDGDEPPGL